MIRYSIEASKVCWRNLGDLRSGRFNHTCGGLVFGDASIMVERFNYHIAVMTSCASTEAVPNLGYG